MKKGIAIIFFFSMLSVVGQRESANWYFGENAGLSFATGAPVALLDGQINTIEGCSSISDAEGNLLFYTEGRTVWNRNHEVMSNGTDLAGSFSSAQAALIVPSPVNENSYYIFTPDDARQEAGMPNGFNYTEVDLSLDGGLGAVSDKNNELLGATSEKVSAVKNEDANFYWTVTHFQDRFYAYRIDATGVNVNPIVSVVGPEIIGVENLRGAVKFSPDGTKLAMASTITAPEFQGSLYLFDFDIDTGIVSNAQLVDDSRVYYGVEFSSNNNFVYASGMQINEADPTSSSENFNIVQFDVNGNFASDSTDGKGFVLATLPSENGVFLAGALQLGLDKRIYHAFPGFRLSVIRQPNQPGAAADFGLLTVGLGGRSATYGLPPFIQSFFETIVTIVNFCEGAETSFTLDETDNIVSISWDFDDPGSGFQNNSTELNPTHIFSQAGSYEVTFEVVYDNGTVRNYTEFVAILPVPQVQESLELVQCDVDAIDDGLTLFNLNQIVPELTNDNIDINVSFFSTENNALSNSNPLVGDEYSNTVNGEVIYARSQEDNECFVISEVTLVTQPLSDLGVYDTITVCNGIFGAEGVSISLEETNSLFQQDFASFDSIRLYASQQDALLETNVLNAQNYTFSPAQGHQLYFRVEEVNQCSFIGQINYEIFEEPYYEPLVTLALCKGEALLQALPGFESYTWSNGLSDQTILVNEVGIIEVVFANGICNYSQQFEILPEPEVDVEDIVIEDFRRNSVITIVLGPDENLDVSQFSVDGGLTFVSNNTFTGLAPDIYQVVVDNGCAFFEQEVLVGGLPSFFTPNADGFNDEWFLNNSEFFPDYSLNIFDRYGKLLSSHNTVNRGWDGTYQNQDMPSGDYWYLLEFVDGRIVKGNFALKR